MNSVRFHSIKDVLWTIKISNMLIMLLNNIAVCLVDQFILSLLLSHLFVQYLMLVEDLASQNVLLNVLIFNS